MTDDICDENGGQQVLKRDVLGRVKTGMAQQEVVLDQFERSGLSGPKFAAVAGIKYATLISWVQRRRRGRAAVSAGETTSQPALGWVEAVVERAAAGSSNQNVLRVHLPGGVGLEIASEFQAALAGQLLRAWQNAHARGPC